MEFNWFLTVIAAISIGLYYFLSVKKKYKLAPGPWNIPFISGSFTAGPYPHITFQKWAEKYGPLIRTRFGLGEALIIDDHKLLREAFNNPVFNGRADFKTLTVFSNGKHGIVNSDGQEWAEQRRFVLKSLRDFGFGKRSLEKFLVDEVQQFLSWMEKNEGVPTQMQQRLVLATVNTLWGIIAGERHAHDDPVVINIMETAIRAFRGAPQAGASLLVLFPKLIEILPKRFLKGWFLLLERIKPLFQIWQNSIDFHIQNPVDENNPRDLIDVYIQEIQKTKDPNSSFFGDRGLTTLRIVMNDLYGAGQATTSETLNWSILYLATFPHVQKKFQAELDSVIGDQRLPSLGDRPNLPFTEALMMEIFRFSSLLPFALFHETTEDATLGGYDVKKGTMIIPNLYSINYSKAIYGDPENFRPERFLDPMEKLVLKNEALMPFGYGKRQCIGESLGRDNFFLFLTSIFQRFEFKFDPGQPQPSLDAPPGFSRDAPKYFVVFKDRIYK